MLQMDSNIEENIPLDLQDKSKKKPAQYFSAKAKTVS